MALNNISQIFNPMSTQTTKSTYANVTQNMSPRKEQAIIIESMEGLTNDDYIDGLEKLISVTEITHISKISGARVCVFLRNSGMVEKLCNKKVQVKDFLFNIRPFIERNKRVVISNVNPVIPDTILIDMLKSKGITPMSQVREIKAGLHKPGRSHIHSFRRQVYIRDEDEKLLPESAQISFDNTAYWIYLSTDSTSCFVCKQSGHVAKMCPEALPLSLTQAQEIQQMNALIESEISLISSITKTSKQTNHDTHSFPPLKAIKRPPPRSIVSDNSTAHNKNEELYNAATNDNTETSQCSTLSISDDQQFKSPKPKTKKKKSNIETPCIEVSEIKS